jgi:hypothetical protein
VLIVVYLFLFVDYLIHTDAAYVRFALDSSATYWYIATGSTINATGITLTGDEIFTQDAALQVAVLVVTTSLSMSSAGKSFIEQRIDIIGIENRANNLPPLPLVQGGYPWIFIYSLPSRMVINSNVSYAYQGILLPISITLLLHSLKSLFASHSHAIRFAVLVLINNVSFVCLFVCLFGH